MDRKARPHGQTEKVKVPKTITAEIAPGELIDKITILEIKLERMDDEEKIRNVRIEWETLVASRDSAIQPSDELDRLAMELKGVNERLWVFEDDKIGRAAWRERG